MCSSGDLWTGVTFVVAVEEFKRAQRFANFKTNELNTVEGQGGQVSGCYVQFFIAHPWLVIIYQSLQLVSDFFALDLGSCCQHHLMNMRSGARESTHTAFIA